MNKQLNKYRMPIAFLIFSIFLSLGCNTTKNGIKNISQKNWISWNIQFEEGKSISEKIQALNAVEKYVINAFFNGTDKEKLLISLRFNTVKNIGSDRLHFSVGLITGRASQQGSSTPIVPPTPPKRDSLHNVNSALQNISLAESR